MLDVTISGHTASSRIVGDPIAHIKTPARIGGRFQIPALASHGPDRYLGPTLPRSQRIKKLVELGAAVQREQAACRLCSRLKPPPTRVGPASCARGALSAATAKTLFDGIGFKALGRDDVADHQASLADGGAAVAIAFAELASGHLTIASCTLSKGKALAESVREQFPRWPVEIVGLDRRMSFTLFNAGNAQQRRRGARRPMALARY